MNTLRSALFLTALLLLLGCSAESGLMRVGADDEQWAVVQPYHHPLAGMGGGVVLGSVPVPENRESAIASQALVLALQEQQLSVTKPELGLDGTNPALIRWETDIAPITAELVTAYNQNFPSLTLRPAIYGVAYNGIHDTSNNTFRYKIAAQLYERGALSKWSNVSDDRYSGHFFVQGLADAVRLHLQTEEYLQR